MRRTGKTRKRSGKKTQRHVEEFEATRSREKSSEELIAKNRMQQRGVNRDY